MGSGTSRPKLLGGAPSKSQLQSKVRAEAKACMPADISTPGPREGQSGANCGTMGGCFSSQPPAARYAPQATTPAHSSSTNIVHTSGASATPAGDGAASQQNGKSSERLPHVSFTPEGYQGAPLPPNEPERHGYLCKLGVLDTAPDPRFDSITQLATLVFKVRACADG